jgi:hypothetical protein
MYLQDNYNMLINSQKFKKKKCARENGFRFCCCSYEHFSLVTIGKNRVKPFLEPCWGGKEKVSASLPTSHSLPTLLDERRTLAESP